MPTVVLAPSLGRWLAAEPRPSLETRRVLTGSTVRELLDALFAEFPRLRDYIVDERGVLRHHVVAFVNGSAVTDKVHLAEAVPADGELYIFQALSGG